MLGCDLGRTPNVVKVSVLSSEWSADKACPDCPPHFKSRSQHKSADQGLPSPSETAGYRRLKICMLGRWIGFSRMRLSQGFYLDRGLKVYEEESLGRGVKFRSKSIAIVRHIIHVHRCHMSKEIFKSMPQKQV